MKIFTSGQSFTFINVQLSISFKSLSLFILITLFSGALLVDIFTNDNNLLVDTFLITLVFSLLQVKVLLLLILCLFTLMLVLSITDEYFY